MTKSSTTQVVKKANSKKKLIGQQPAAQLRFDTYDDFFSAVKLRVSEARIKAALAVNREQTLLYWEIGKHISAAAKRRGWGAKVVDQLSADLLKAFPEIKGFSVRNLKYMRTFAEAYPNADFRQQAAAQIPWFHNCLLLDKITDLAERLWYIQQVIKSGWSRNVLALQIDSDAYGRQGKTITNFRATLPEPQSNLAQEMLKDPYNLDFLSVTDPLREREVQAKLILHLREFLLELGVGFAFIGSEYHLDVGDRDFYLDLLFYHTRLHCYVVVELKRGEFKPEYAGKMNFYLSAVDSKLALPSDNPSIGLILCQSRDKVIAEYSLRDVKKPVGISSYKITKALPKEFSSTLPTIKEIERELTPTKPKRRK